MIPFSILDLAPVTEGSDASQAFRNTLDLACIPVLRRLTHLPIIIDPSHATGKSWLVDPLAVGAVATGADGLLIEVHNDPAHALCDGAQSLRPEAFDALLEVVLRDKAEARATARARLVEWFSLCPDMRAVMNARRQLSMYLN